MTRSIAAAFALFFSAALFTVTLCGGARAEPAGATMSEAKANVALQALLPSGVFFDTFKLDGRRVQVSGNAPSNALVSQFLRAIDTSAAFEKVELIEVQQVNGRIHYKLMADLE